MDVKELVPGGIARFQQRFRESTAAAAVERSDQGNSTGPASTHPVAPPQAHVRSAGQERTQLAGPLTQHTFDHIPDQLNKRTGGTQGVEMRYTWALNPRYLLLCVNTKRLTTLVHIDLTLVNHDQTLCRQIRHHYQETRQLYEWRLSMLVPKWLCPNRLVTFCKNLHVYIPQTADFVKVHGLLSFQPFRICTFQGDLHPLTLYIFGSFPSALKHAR